MVDNSQWLTRLILKTENRLPKPKSFIQRTLENKFFQEVFWFTGMIASIVSLAWACKTLGIWF
ncbi:MAG: hypothetical protein Q8K36_04180 [Alphaproteobacteria bacterium]|nr:hypothetical protein [Alphaproteobacteria bacterium]